MTTSGLAAPVDPSAQVGIRRWSAAASVTTVVGGLLLVLFAALPYLVGPQITQPMVTLFLLVGMATLWNLLAGFAGMISFGQQAYIGIGAYTVYLVGLSGLSPFVAIPLGALTAGIFAVPIFLLLHRLAGGYFAVTSWVVAESLRLFTVTQPWLGGGTGVGLRQLSSLEPVFRQALTYWSALTVMTVCVIGVYLLVRSPFGLDTRAVHDDPVAASTNGVEVRRTRYLAYVLAALGTGAVGAVLIISNVYIQPDSVFGINYSVDMMFMVVIGGVGTMEGAIFGAVLFFAAQQAFAGYGAWYLIAIGLLAVGVVLTAPGGLWGTVAQRYRISLLPVDYRVRQRGPQHPRESSWLG